MALIKNTKQGDNKSKRIILVNQSEDTIKRFAKYADKTLVDVDLMETGKLEDITLGRKEWEGGDDILNLVLVFKNEKVAFPLSRGFGDDVTNDPTVLLEGQFYKRKRMKEGDAEGEPTGDEYISFGKPSGLNFTEETSLVGVEATAGA